jgi:glycosyltransferase involved in cell wall biosynthesis
MRIGINCIRLSPAYKGGVNSFTFGLLDAFAAGGRGHDFVIFSTARNRILFRRYEGIAKFRIVLLDGAAGRLGRGLFNRLPWRLRARLPHAGLNRLLNLADEYHIAREADVQYVPHCPTLIFPYPDIPTLYSIHDLQHVHFPEFFSAGERWERDAAFANAIAHASAIQASSRQMAEEFMAHFPGLSEERIVAVPEGVDVAAFRSAPKNDVRARYGLPEHFLFYPAQLWPHKNHITIFKALTRLHQAGLDIPLVLTGARYAGADELAPYLDRVNNVFYLGIVPFADIIALHRTARFLLTASRYEASSIPILEAAAAGTAIIASATPSHSEHAEELQIQLFPPSDDAALAELLRKVWPDDALIARQTAYNAGAIERFTWMRAAEHYLDAMERLSSLNTV